MEKGSTIAKTRSYPSADVVASTPLVQQGVSWAL